MKQYFTLIFSLLIVSAFSQDSTKLTKRIMRHVNEINSDSPYVILEPDYKKINRPSRDGGFQVRYYQKTYVINNNITIKVKKILQLMKLLNTDIITEFYIDNDKLIFVRMREWSSLRDTSNNLQSYTTNLIFEGNYYFREEKLLYLNEKGHTKPHTKDSLEKDFIDAKKEYFANKPKGTFFIKRK
jgi:hypothetical protein